MPGAMRAVNGRSVRRHPLLLVVSLFLALNLAGCGDDGESPNVATVPATFTVSPGVEHVRITNAGSHATLVLYDEGDHKLLGLITDQFGQAVFSYIPDKFITVQSGPGATISTTDGRSLKRGTYTVRDESQVPHAVSAPFHVLGRDDVAPESFYAGQQLNAGFGYIEMRDGVKLSATLRLPPGDGPFPTVIEYSGYGPSNPEAIEPGSQIAQAFGYATVGVNMRGTGCSGGVFDVFNPAQQADGYDVIEAVAHQPWVLNHKVGMVGLSYSGISQLYTASTQPPSLAAITSLSVIEDPWRQQWPGGVYNAGFTKQWLAQRDAESAPGGRSWVQRRIEQGDVICAEHEVLRNQNVDFEQFGRALETYPKDEDDRRLGLLVRKINVPVFLTGAWQDEQTGSLFATMLSHFDQAPVKRFTVFNGHHPDGYGPKITNRWFEFLEFYVAKRIPHMDPLARALVQPVLGAAFGVGTKVPFEADRFTQYTDYDQARAAYEAEDQVRVLFEVGDGAKLKGAGVAKFEKSFPTWPPAATARTWYLDSSGRLADAISSTGGVDRYQHDPGAGPKIYTTGRSGDFQSPTISYDWPPLPDGLGLSYLTDPLPENVVIAGNGGYADLWFASEAADANIEVTLTDVHPDGTEFIVQSGVFRAAHRQIDTALSQPFLIQYTFSAAGFHLLTPGQFLEVKVPFRPFSHPFRAGSRARLIISTPGRDSPLWAYENPSYDGKTISHQVAHTAAMASRIVFPEVDGVDVTGGMPPCPSLRGQICRPYVALNNESAN